MKKNRSDLDYDARNLNPRISGSFDSSPDVNVPPPLPPRGLHSKRNHLSSFERAQWTDLPTVEVGYMEEYI